MDKTKSTYQYMCYIYHLGVAPSLPEEASEGGVNEKRAGSPLIESNLLFNILRRLSCKRNFDGL